MFTGLKAALEGVSDLKMGAARGTAWPLSCCHVQRAIRSLPTVGLYPPSALPSLRSALRRGLQDQAFLLLAAVRLFGLCSVDLARKFARHQSLSQRACRPALSSGAARSGQAQQLYADQPLDLDLKQTIYALDASIIDLCLSVYPWARFDALRSGLKIHTQLEVHSALPAQIRVSLANFQDVVWLDELLYEPGAFYLMDRAYVDWRRLYAIEQARAWFVVRAKKSLRYSRLHSQPIDPASGLRSDQIISLQAFYAAKKYPDKLRRVRFYDGQRQRALVFLTNHFGLSALSVAQLYQRRWQVELFFRWIKQHLRIKSFYGTSATRSARNCGWRCRSTHWSPSSKNGSAAMPRSTKFSKS